MNIILLYFFYTENIPFLKINYTDNAYLQLDPGKQSK